ncbi:hypothetical protein GRI89_05185 [Altererythrobacter salegens]|uniref:5-bromo-4-chloroindolyl phosphate hydrolysis protein n=1 Tax=Croceibacterium salegens TaxID=1737568 RepID=A0A6I4SSH1_9SPHN|nr:hypothetical protein [Croceibacterium salegens]MXO58931.1 hypothetical protein [Croceibacterium salegens]
MADSTGNSQEIMAAASRSLAHNRAGGRRLQPIGEGSRRMRREFQLKKLRNIAYAAAGIFAFSVIAGIVIDGIGFTGIVLTFMALLAAGFIFGKFPRMKVPQRGDLNKGDVRQMVARTELWLENQRPALPPLAITLVDQIGTQLDALGLQLETIDQSHPAAQETRKLVGEHLPEMVDAYRRIPANLRGEKRAGSTPDEQLVESLGKISGEIDHVTRQLAEGSLDDLAIRTRYLGYRYGETDEPVSENN